MLEYAKKNENAKVLKYLLLMHLVNSKLYASHGQ